MKWIDEILDTCRAAVVGSGLESLEVPVDQLYRLAKGYKLMAEAVVELERQRDEVRRQIRNLIKRIDGAIEGEAHSD